jgi:hypothetical protein
MPNFDLGDYVDVNERLGWFFEHFPEGSLQADILERGEDYVVIKAVAYRSPTDARPGTGMASEPVPGRTPYTKDSEVMVGETSAWGRALAAIGAPTKGSIASRQEVQNRRTSPVRSDEPLASALAGDTTSPAAGPDGVVTPSGVATTEPAEAPQAGGSTSGGGSSSPADTRDAGPRGLPPSGTSSGPEAGGISAKGAAQDPGPDSSGDGEAPGMGAGEQRNSPASSKYPLDPSKCSHKFPSGRWLKWDAEGRCPRCGTSKLVAMEGTTADLGPA